MKKNIQAFIIYLTLNFCFFLLIFFSVAAVELEHKKNIADAAVKLTRESFLVGDYRSVSKDIDKIKTGNFHKIEVFGKNNKLITVVTDGVSELSLKFKKTIWIDGNSTVLKGFLIFSVGLNHLLILSLKILLGTVFISGPVFIFFVMFLRRRQKALIENENIRVAEQIARQVSHDIRSPLAALKMALEDSDSIPSEQRAIIRSSVQRINDIANNLLISEMSEKKSSEMNIELFGPLVDTLVSEKRMQFRDKIGIQIECDLSNSYGIFAKINSVELKRVLSNLINNAVEAISGDGKVIVKIAQTSEGNILLSVSDNGIGMPEHILKRLGEKGFSYGKSGQESGSGIGFHHAKKTIESFGGNLEVKSVVGRGSTVSVFLKKAILPSWFVDKLNIYNDKKILILDDDESMLQVWSGRLPVKPEVFTSGEEFSKAIKTIPLHDLIALVDYELLGQTQNGLEIIKSLQIEKQSILVTSRFTEKEILETCNLLGVRLIPKTMVSLIPIEIVAQLEECYDFVYIDDDMLMRISWEQKALRQNKRLLLLASTKDFEVYLDKINKDTTVIYIDNNLGDGEMKGEDFATILHSAGYKKLFIASGDEKEHFSHLPWLGYAGKKCPF